MESNGLHDFFNNSVSNAYIMSNYMTCWSSSMAQMIRQQGILCHTKCLGCQCSVMLHHSWLPGHNILAIREMMQEILRHGELGECGRFSNAMIK